MAFIRKKMVKGIEYIFCVKSVREGKKVKQVIIANLGRADKSK